MGDKRKPFSGICYLAAAAVLVLTRTAHADYESDKNAKHLGVIERAAAKFVKDPAIFDGAAIAAGASTRAVYNHIRACNNVIKQFNAYYPRVSAKGKATDRAKAVVATIRALDPYCKALTAAGNAFIAAAQAKDKAAADARAAMKTTCDAVRRDALATIGGAKLHDVLDTWRGARTPTAADHVVTFRTDLEKLAPVCANPAYRGVVAGCKGQGILQSSATNQRYDYGDICAPAIDTTKTLTAVAMRLLEHLAGRGARDMPTVDTFRRDDGWIHSTGVVRYATYFRVDDAKKQEIMAHVKAAFDAAGVAPPSDLSMLWANQQTYLDALKSVVDATVGEWSMSHSACKGYACRLAKKSIKNAYKTVSIKKVWAKDWRISKNSLGVPLEQYKTMFVLYQVRGETHCQVRSLTAHEPYKGGGNYKKAKGTRWGYVRFQRCR